MNLYQEGIFSDDDDDDKQFDTESQEARFDQLPREREMAEDQARIRELMNGRSPNDSLPSLKYSRPPTRQVSHTADWPGNVNVSVDLSLNLGLNQGTGAGASVPAAQSEGNQNGG